MERDYTKFDSVIKSDAALAKTNREFAEKVGKMTFVRGWAEIIKEGTGKLIDMADSWLETKLRGGARIIRTLVGSAPEPTSI